MPSLLTWCLLIAFAVVLVIILAWLAYEVRADRRDREEQDGHRKWLRGDDESGRWPPRGDV